MDSMILFLALWVVFSGLIATIASAFNRNGLIWFLISLTLSPLLGLILVGVLGKVSMGIEEKLMRCNSCEKTTKFQRNQTKFYENVEGWRCEECGTLGTRKNRN